MAINYELHRNPDAKQSGEKQPLHPRFISSGNITTENLCERAGMKSTIKAYELKAALELLANTAMECLSEGRTVELGEFGTLSLSLKGRAVMEKTEIRSVSIHVSDLTLRTSKEMKQRLSRIELQRNPYAWNSLPLDTEKRDELLEEFFKSNMILTRTQYENMRKCKRQKALDELNELVAEGRLERYGRRNQGLYILRKSSPEGD